MEFTEVVRNRYSCKNFDAGKAVDAAKLTEILEAGRVAPTAKNFQEQKIYVIQSAEGLAKIDKATPCRYNAPTCLVVAFDRTNVFTYPGGRRDSGVEDATIVATHMILAAAKRAGPARKRRDPDDHGSGPCRTGRCAAAEPWLPQAACGYGSISVIG